MSIFETFDPAKSLGQQVKYRRKKPKKPFNDVLDPTRPLREQVPRQKPAPIEVSKPAPAPAEFSMPTLNVGAPKVQRELPEPIVETGFQPPEPVRGTPESAPRQTKKTTRSGPTPEEIRARIAAEEKASAIRNLRAAFGKTERALGAEEEALDPMFLEQRGDIRTQDIFARRRADVSAATGGLSTSGAASQANLQQNVLTQGAMSESRQQESDLRADIGRRLTEARALMNQGVADAETAADVRRLESELKELETAQAARLEAAKIADERAYDMQVMQLENMNDQQMVLLESELDKQEQLIDAQIQEARDNRLYAQEQSLLAQKAAINAKQAAVEEQLRQQTEVLKSNLTLGEIAARGEEDRLTRGTETPERLIGEDTYAAAIEKAESDALSQGLTPEQARVKAATQLVNLAIQEQDNMSEEMFNKLMLEYGITEADIHRATQGGL